MGVNYTYLAHGRDKSWTRVNMVRELEVP